MNDAAGLRALSLPGEFSALIRVRGLVQGVGFRPTVWRLAKEHGLRGWVANDGQGVSVQVCGAAAAIDAFVRELPRSAPPLARIDSIEREAAAPLPADADFRIVESRGERASSATGAQHTGVVPDAASCAACVQETLSPFERRYRYPFTNCTHCGPRLSIIESIPYDRATTTMRDFPLCAACAAEYENPADRRFHAQPVACHRCGPRAWLERADRAPFALDAITTLDDVDATCSLLQRGHIVAIKGLGGYQLACDAANETTVTKLRDLKRRERKPLALMARDLEVIRRYCKPTAAEAALLQGAAAPIVIMAVAGKSRVASGIAPGVATLGFMLPATPLHHLVLRRMDRPIVLTSGNLADEPQCIDNTEARTRLGGIAEYFLMHDRDVARRVDDSVVRIIANAPRVLRRARGYAPAPIALPRGFGQTPAVLALGGELKNTFCLVREGQAILSHHIGDLDDALTNADFQGAVGKYLELFEHLPQVIAIDQHPEYLSSKFGRELAQRSGVTLIPVQHHHAHIASCMAENGIALDDGPVLGVALDGSGFGPDGTLWGGEFLFADYRSCKRLATFKPVPLLGGEQAVHEPWRSTYAHLLAEMGWPRFAMNYAELDLYDFLEAKPRTLLDGMASRQVNSPLASSCGRLFDAVAAAAGLCRGRVQYEGQAAIEFEALVDPATLRDENDELAYPFAIPRLKITNMPYVEPLAMWQALLGDLILRTPVPVIAARFHKGLAIVIARMIDKLSRYESGAGDNADKSGGDADNGAVKTVALSGGVFQNSVLLEQVVMRLERMEFRVLTHREVPANDGGLALGQAAIAAAQWLAAANH